MAKPTLHWNSIANRWEAKGKTDNVEFAFGVAGNYNRAVSTIGQNLNVGSQAVLQQLRVGSGTAISFILRAVATLVGNLAIGSGMAIAEGTLQSTTGSGIGVAGLNMGDFVFGAPKISLDTAQIVGFRIPTTNTLVGMFTTRDQSAGSLAAGAGFDIAAIR